MVIELKTADNPEWKPKLVFTKLAVGDYIVLSVERMHKEITGGQYGSSFMCFVKVYEYSYFDTAARKVVDAKFPDGAEASTFFNEGIYNKISKNPEKTLIKISAVETKNGKVAYDAKPFSIGKATDGEIIDVEFNNEGKMVSALEKESILSTIKSMRTMNFTDKEIEDKLVTKYPAESIKELLALK
jgi:hypothetical protein